MKMRKGFTLVELLIVIVIIGILAAAMLLSSGSATAAAKASNIISDLRSLKTASLMLYSDSMDEFDLGTTSFNFSGAAVKTSLGKYVDNPEKYAANFKCETNNSKWWISYTIPSGEAGKAEIQDKLKGKAKSVGLYKAVGDLTSANAYDGASGTVYMVAR